MKGKRGWLRILEATIAVIIVSGVMLVVYTGQADKGVSQEDYIYSLQKQVLADIALNQSLRLKVLNVSIDNSSDQAFRELNTFVDGKIPSAYGYLLRVCKLGDTTDYCRMNTENYIATMKNDIYVKETIIAAEVGSGGDEAIYNPKKVRLFVWEGDYRGVNCAEECSVDACIDLVRYATCEDIDDDQCMDWGTITDCSDAGAGWVCNDSTTGPECEACISCGSDYLFCSGNRVMKYVCGNFDEDSCDDLNDTADLEEDCDDEYNMVCEEDGNGWADCVEAYPVLTASYSNVVRHITPNPDCQVDEDVWFSYDMEITEIGGSVIATLESRQKCVNVVGYEETCTPLTTEMPSSFNGNYIVPAGGSISGADRWFCITSGYGYTYNLTETFYSDELGENELVNYTVPNLS